MGLLRPEDLGCGNARRRHHDEAMASGGAEAWLRRARADCEAGPEWPPAPVRPVQTAAVVGAGTMGADIAQTLLAAGIRTRLLDADAQALARGAGHIRASLQRAVARGRIDPADATQRLALLDPTLDWRDLADVDAAIEAVPERLGLKQEVMRQLARHCPPRAWFASNTSTLSISAIAGDAATAGRLAGMHFLTPAHVTPLLEVVRGDRTLDATVAAARALARRIGKLPVQARDAWGFIGNRMFEGYLAEVDALQLGGVPAERIDAALQGFGFALGPCRTIDMAGTDVIEAVLAERAAALPAGWPPRYRAVSRRLAALGRFGRKSGRGHYLHGADGSVRPDPELPALCAALAAGHGIAPLPPLTDAQIAARCMQPLIDEGRALLAEGVARRAGDIDLVWVMGYGFPAGRGGPMYLAGRTTAP